MLVVVELKYGKAFENPLVVVSKRGVSSYFHQIYFEHEGPMGSKIPKMHNFSKLVVSKLTLFKVNPHLLK